jgi:cytochrome P450
MFLTLIIVVFALLLVYWYLKLKYFTLYGPLPGLAPEFFYGNMRQTGISTRNESIEKVRLELKRRFGDVYQFWRGASRSVVVSNADDVQHILSHRNIYEQGNGHIKTFSLLFQDSLICDIGAKYKRHASVIVPLLRRGKISKHFDLIIDCTDKLLLDRWRLSNKDHIHCDIVDQSKHLIMALFGHIAFNYDLEMPVGNALTQALHDYLAVFRVTADIPTIMGKIYLMFSSKYRESKSTIEQYFDRMIKQEQNDNSESINERAKTSLIGSLVNSMQKDEKMEASKIEDEKKGLSRSEIIHEMLFFLVAGVETTATALSWFIHFVSKYPHVQTKLKAELGDNSFSMDRLDSLVYLDAVIREVLRLRSPSTGTVRTLLMDDRLPATGAQLYKGDQVIIPFYNLQWDTRYWKIDPELFYPERFLDDSLDKNHHPAAFIPFGGGHRQCVGQDLARFELKTIVARLMQCVTFGDGGPDVNSGGHDRQFSVTPKRIGVTISFD